MLETLHFLPKPQGSCSRVLGVIVSQAPREQAVNFSVPAHVLLTLNVLLQGSLMHEQKILPNCFATGAHTRSRRYQISPGALLLTLFCRADAALDLCTHAPAQLTDTWLPAQSVFKAWQESSSAKDALLTAQAMLSCVSPEHLPALEAPARLLSAQRMRHALHALVERDLPATCTQLQMSERSLQRLFMSQWGISPKLVQRMLRIQRSVKLWEAQKAQSPNLADIAAQVGLADQAHLAREFRQLVGYAPSSLKRPAIGSEQKQENTLWALRTGSSLLAPLLQ
jgi:AraC-like DNA-binding protein